MKKIANPDQFRRITAALLSAFALTAMSGCTGPAISPVDAAAKEAGEKTKARGPGTGTIGTTDPGMKSGVGL